MKERYGNRELRNSERGRLQEKRELRKQRTEGNEVGTNKDGETEKQKQEW